MTPIKSLPDIMAGLDLIGIRWFCRDDLEADDVIATLAVSEAERCIFIMSTDRDFYQLVSDSVLILNTRMRKGNRVIGRSEILERYGVDPERWCDFRALTGDQSDGIPGVWGVGPVTARRLLAGGIGLEGMGPLGRLTGKRVESIKARETWDSLVRSRSIMRLRTDVPVPSITSGRPTPEMPLAAAVLEG